VKTQSENNKARIRKATIKNAVIAARRII